MPANARLTRWGRWVAVVAGILALACLPAAVGAWPTEGAALAPAALLARVQASRAVAYSGFVQADGGLGLPVTESELGSIADLLGGPTQLRVWWRAATDYRVDTVDFSGETDTYRSSAGQWTWDYERNQATFTSEPVDPTAQATVRLPRATDLLPPELGRRLLDQATPAEVGALPAARIAGHTVAGLRLRPAQPASTVDHVDVWADPATGLPVRVAVYGRTGPAVMDTRFLDLSTAEPAPARTAFAPPAGARLSTQDALDLAGLIDRFGGVRPPGRLAGLDRNATGPAVGMVGTYGRGVTEMSVAAVPGRDAGGLRTELAKAPGATTDKDGSVSLGVGPLQLLLGPAGRRNAAWLLFGTVSPNTLSTALAQLPAPVGFRR